MMHILELLEFQILAAARGMEQYYGFLSEQEWQKEDVYYAVHQMVQSGILKQAESHLEVQPPLSRYLDWMETGKQVLVVDAKESPCPRQCLYETDVGCLCLERSATDQDKVFLYEIGSSQLEEEWECTGQLPREKITEDIGNFDFMAYWEQHLSGETRNAMEKGFQADAEELLGCSQVYGIFSLHDKVTGELGKRLILLDMPMEYCMVVQSWGEDSHWMRYSKAQAMEEINVWWREKP